MLDFILDPTILSADLARVLGWAAESWAIFCVVHLLRFGIIVGAVYLILNVWLRPRIEHRRIQKKHPRRRDYRRELLYGLGTVGVFAVMSTLVAFMYMHDVGYVYLNIADIGGPVWGWVYFAFSIVALIVLHDAWFFWTHWMMHHRWLYKPVHRIHHKSHNPTATTAYAFSPPEAVIQSIYVPIVVLFLPTHPIAIVLFIIHMIIRNSLLHSGYELMPKGFRTHWLGRHFTTTTHHDLHHSGMTGNYGLYFVWWDKLMGTFRDDHDATFDEVTSRPKAAPEQVEGRATTA